MRQNQTWSDITTYLQISGIPATVSSQLDSLIHFWIKKSGVEWTCKRLKSLYVWRIRSIQDPTYSAEFFKVKNSGVGLVSRPAGPFGYLWSIDLNTALRVLRVYTTLSLTTASSTQENKFFSGMEREWDGTGDSAINFVEGVCKDISIQGDWHPLPFSDNMRKVTKSRNKRAPGMRIDRSVYTGYESEIPVPDHVHWIHQNIFVLDYAERLTPPDEEFKSSGGFALGNMFQIPGAFMPPGFPKPVVREVEKSSYTEIYSLRGNNPKVITSGRISYIQEPGCKLRAIANPGRPFQVLLEPLKRTLMNWLKGNPNDFTHDQYKGAERVSQWQKEGRQISCFDLSDATSLFPATLTFNLLRQSLNDTWKDSIDLFELVSKGNWLCPDGQMRQFKTGQPLGLGPSFAAFAFSHHCVVEAARLAALEDIASDSEISEEQRRLELQQVHNSDYVIVGDDIVISGQILANYYVAYMGYLQVPISIDKSIPANNRISEFVGHIILDGKITASKKWRKPTNDNFLDLVRNLGPRIIPFLEPRHQFILNRIKDKPEPIGFGWNPKGIPLSDRMEGWEELYEKPSILRLPNDARDSSLSHEEICLLKNSKRQTQGVTSSITPTSEQPVAPSLKLLWQLAQSGLPINGNLERIQKLCPELFQIRTLQTKTVFYHKSYWGRDVRESSSVEVKRNNQFLESRLKYGRLRDKHRSLFKIYKDMIVGITSSEIQ